MLRGLWAVDTTPESADWLVKLSSVYHLENISPPLQTWILRILGNHSTALPEHLERATALAAIEQDAGVRRELASLAQKWGYRMGSAALVHALLKRSEDANDPVIPLMLWLAYERKLAAKPSTELEWLKSNSTGNPLITDHIVPRAMRRLVATGKPDDIAASVAFAAGVADPVRLRALEGLVEALKGRQVDAPANWADAQAKLLADPSEQVKKLAGTLAINFRDKAAIAKALALAADATQPAAARAEAIRTIAPVPMPNAKPILLKLAAEPGDIGIEAIRALAGYNTRDIPSGILRQWKNLSPAVNRGPPNCWRPSPRARSKRRP
jgi:hypothetical protein